MSGIVNLCTKCGHVHPDCPPNRPYVTCGTCGCSATTRQNVQDQDAHRHQAGAEGSWL